MNTLPAAAEFSMKTEGERTDVELGRRTNINRRLFQPFGAGIIFLNVSTPCI